VADPPRENVTDKVLVVEPDLEIRNFPGVFGRMAFCNVSVLTTGRSPGLEMAEAKAPLPPMLGTAGGEVFGSSSKWMPIQAPHPIVWSVMSGQHERDWVW
jgi:hypothetical protein